MPDGDDFGGANGSDQSGDDTGGDLGDGGSSRRGDDSGTPGIVAPRAPGAGDASRDRDERWSPSAVVPPNPPEPAPGGGPHVDPLPGDQGGPRGAGATGSPGRGTEAAAAATDADVAAEREAARRAVAVDDGERSGTWAPVDLSGVERVPGARKPDPILVVDGVTRRFGGLTAVDVEHLEIPRGAITALIGPNGAGKTTLFNLLTGFDKPDAGTWSFDGESLGGVAAHQVARRGMVRTFQLTKSLQRLSVIENMKLGSTDQKGEKFLNAILPFVWRAQEREIEARADELLVRFRLDHMREEFAGALSGGQRKLLEMARALMVQPRLVMLDEPMAGVNPALTQSLLGHVKSLREDGMSVMFVEHDMDVVQDISDWVIVMGQGKVIAEGRPEEIAADPVVIDAYLGGHHDAPLTEEEEAAVLAEAEAEIHHEHDHDRGGRK